MRNLRYNSEALDNIADIAVHIAQATGSRALAARIASDIRRRCARLASLPGTLGRPREELRHDLRSIVVKSYVIFFRYEGRSVVIVAVLEGHRDIDAYFRDGVV